MIKKHSIFRDELQNVYTELLKFTEPDIDHYHAQVVLTRPWVRLVLGQNSIGVIVPAVTHDSYRNIKLQNISVRFNVTVDIVQNRTRSTQNVAIIETVTRDAAVEKLFLDVISILLPAIPFVNNDNLVEIINDLIAFFRALTPDSKKDALGLWGELFVIARANNASILTQAWHSNPVDLYDFSLHDQRIEVKTTTGPRKHIFSYPQTVTSPDISVLLASIITQETDSGKSVREMLDLVQSKISDPKLITHVEKLAMQTLAKSWIHGSEFRCDYDLACQSLKWFKMQDIPRLAPPPLHVYDIQFKSDLQLSIDLQPAELSLSGNLGMAFVK